MHPVMLQQLHPAHIFALSLLQKLKHFCPAKTCMHTVSVSAHIVTLCSGGNHFDLLNGCTLRLFMAMLQSVMHNQLTLLAATIVHCDELRHFSCHVWVF